jgi:osmotically-inducible protein OsmY
MKNRTQNLTDHQLRYDVLRQLDCESDFSSAAIGVGAAGSVVTLTGFVNTFAEKLAAEYQFAGSTEGHQVPNW